jgi:mannose-6-phosphate isomerase-like protein (cupin superfamily)
MTKTRVDFDNLQWEAGTIGVRFKAAECEGRRIRLVELTSDDVAHDWCVKGHIGYVLEGDMELAFSDRTERLKAGDGLFIKAGHDDRHRPRVTGSKVKLVLVEDI